MIYFKIMKKEDLPKKLAVFPLSNFIIFPKTTVPLKMKFPTPPEVLMEEGAKMETIEERKNSDSQN